MEAIQKLEAILGIKLEKKRYGKSYDPNQKNTYSFRQGSPESLRLDNVTIDDFAALVPYLERLRYLEINDSTIPNFAQLLRFNYADLRLNRVVFQNNNCDIAGDMPWHMQFSNMKFDATCLQCFQNNNIKGFKQVEFKNCHIDNIQEIGDLEYISLLILDKITFTHQPKQVAKKATRRLIISNSSFEEVAFLPFSASLENIDFSNCQIGSIAGLTEFPMLKEIRIDSDTTIEDRVVYENTSGKKMACVFTQAKQPLDLRVLTSLQNYLDTLQLSDYQEKTIDFIEIFKRVKHLAFDQSTVYVDALLPIAKQIETIGFSRSTIKKYKYFGYFKNLTSFESENYEEDNQGLRTFKKILPLKDQLKVLNIRESQKINAPHLIKAFTALESLKIAYDVPIQTVEYILTLKSLKKLSLSVEDKPCTLSLENLKSLEALILRTEGHFTGFEHLQKLKSLKMGSFASESTMDVNALPRIESLQRLNLESYDCEIKGLEQFPNLEALKIKGSPKVKLGRLEYLKVLSLENSAIEDFSLFETLPHLEKLDLSSMQNKVNLADLYKFPSLKYLTFLESKIDDLAHLEPLKKLEYLDLYSTFISDVRVLNTLPNLKEVNLSTGSGQPLETQLDNPEVAIYCGLPTIYIWIWEKDEFGI